MKGPPTVLLIAPSNENSGYVAQEKENRINTLRIVVQPIDVNPGLPESFTTRRNGAD